MNHPYIDLHTHTCLSDGNLTPEELLTAAREAGIGILAITDHNSTGDLTAWRAAFPGPGHYCRRYRPGAAGQCRSHAGY